MQNIKEIAELVDPLPVMTGPQIALAEAMAESTLSPLAAIVGLFLPVSVGQEWDVLYQIIDQGRWTMEARQWPLVQRRLLELLTERGPMRGRQIDAHFRKVEWRNSANALVRKGVLAAKSVLPPPRVRSKHVRVALLAVPPEEAEAQMPSLGTRQTLARRQAALHYLIHQPSRSMFRGCTPKAAATWPTCRSWRSAAIRLFESEIFRDPLERLGRRAEAERYPGRFE